MTIKTPVALIVLKYNKAMPAPTAGIAYPSSIVNSSSTDIPKYLDILRANSKKPLCSELTKCVVILSSNEHDDEDVAMRKEHKQWNRINEFTKKNNLEPMKIYRRGIMGQGVLNEYYRNAIAYMRSGKADALVVVNMAMISSGIADAYYKVGQVVEAGFKVYTVDEKEQSLYLYQPPVRKEA